MRRTLKAAVLAVLILLELPVTAATPYWVKPGVYIEYAAHRYDPYFSLVTGARPDMINTAMLIYSVNGTLFRIEAHNDTRVRFEFLGVKEGFLKVRGIIEMENVTVTSIGLNSTEFPKFWDSGDVISEKLEKSHDVGFLDCVWLVVNLRKLTLAGEYRIRLNDSAVLGMNGTYYGHTFLWVDTSNPPKTGTIFSKAGTFEIAFSALRSINRSMMTYYGQFGPPLVALFTNFTRGEVSFAQRIDSGRKYMLMDISLHGPGPSLIYDPSTGIAVYPNPMSMAPYADFMAMGILWAEFVDEKAAYRMMAEKDDSWGYGLVLYDTNADFEATEEVQFPRPETPSEYAYYASLGLLVLMFVLTVVRKRR